MATGAGMVPCMIPRGLHRANASIVAATTGAKTVPGTADSEAGNACELREQNFGQWQSQTRYHDAAACACLHSHGRVFSCLGLSLIAWRVFIRLGVFSFAPACHDRFGLADLYVQLAAALSKAN